MFGLTTEWSSQLPTIYNLLQLSAKDLTNATNAITHQTPGKGTGIQGKNVYFVLISLELQPQSSCWGLNKLEFIQQKQLCLQANQRELLES